MADRPILFSAPMVRAIFAGTKTQTRRIVKHRHGWHIGESDGLHGKSAEGTPWPLHDAHVYAEPEPQYMDCPYGEPGDRLWVRETFYVNHVDHVRGPLPAERPRDVNGEPCEIIYRADGDFADHFEQVERGDAVWRPSIFCKRWASRITLDVTAVRVERLQDITEEDARAEGVEGGLGTTEAGTVVPFTARYAYMRLWDRINAKRAPWASNPWVWCITFARAA